MTNQSQNAKQTKTASKDEPKKDEQLQAKEKKDKAAKEQEELVRHLSQYL